MATKPFRYQEMFPMSADTTEYYHLTSDYVKTEDWNGHEMLVVDPEALTVLARQATHDNAFMLRREHNEMVAKILHDPEASENDKFVALTMLRNAEVAAKGQLPFCQDTGTAIIHGNKGQNVYTGGGDEERLSKGVYLTYTEDNLRYSQNAPLTMFDEVNTGCNLPAQIDLHAVDGKESTEKGAHPNSRFTAPAINCPCISPEFNNPQGVPISAIVFGGRRAKTAPLVYQSFDWNHGVFVGSIMASETTAAAAGAVGVVRRDPMAMLPFCGYNMGDYFGHWIEMGKKIPNKPKIFNVNWFRTDEDGHFIWPGFGDNLRVLEWIMKRAFDEVDAVETEIGYMPKPEDINIEGLSDVTLDTMKSLLSVDKELWKEDVKNIKEFYAKFDEFDTLPQELKDELAALEKRLG